MAEYQKKIAYLDYLENGMKIKNAGFVKAEENSGQMRLEMRVKNIPETFIGQYELQAEDGGTVGRISLNRGCGSCCIVWQKGKKIPEGKKEVEANSVFIRLPGRRLLQAVWTEPIAFLVEKKDEPQEEVRKDSRIIDFSSIAEKKESSPAADSREEQPSAEACQGERPEPSIMTADYDGWTPYRAPEDVIGYPPDNEISVIDGAAGYDRTEEPGRAAVSDRMPEREGMSESDRMPEREGMSENDRMPEREGMSESDRMPEREGMSENDRMPEQEGIAENERSSRPERAGKNNKGPEPVSGRDEVFYGDKWEQLCHMYPLIHPFQDEREYLSIAPKDFVILRQEYQKMVHNSFMLHGYYNYKHLILGKIPEKDGMCYYLGVPGNFYGREKMVAEMFGFEAFEGERTPAQPGDFGYFMKQVDI